MNNDNGNQLRQIITQLGQIVDVKGAFSGDNVPNNVLIMFLLFLLNALTPLS